MSGEVTLYKKLEEHFNKAAAKHPEWKASLDLVTEFSVSAEDGPRLCVDLYKVRDLELRTVLEAADKMIKEHKGPLR